MEQPTGGENGEKEGRKGEDENGHSKIKNKNKPQRQQGLVALPSPQGDPDCFVLWGCMEEASFDKGTAIMALDILEAL